MKRLLKKQYINIVILILLLLIVYLNRDKLSEFRKIQDISILSIFYISLLFILGQFINAYRLKIFIEVFQVKLGFWESFGLICIQSFGNYLPLSAGIASNMAYLKVKKKVPVSKYVSYLAGETIIKILVFGVLGLLQLLWISIMIHNVSFMLFLILFAFILFSLICIFLPIRKKYSKNKFINWFIQIHKGWEEIKNRRSVIVKSMLSHIFILILITIQYSIIFREISYSINIFYIFILTIMTNVIRIASIFPGNLGLRESTVSEALRR